MWQISIPPVPMYLIFGTYHESASQIPCAKYKHSTVNGQFVRDHRNSDISLILKATLKKNSNIYDLFIQN